MLDTAPPPAIYEEAPSGLWLPKRFSMADAQVPREAILPGMTPYPGLIAGGQAAGSSQVPPWPVPTTYIASWNGTATSGVASASAAVATLKANSAILVWVVTRTTNPDPNPQSHIVTDNQGGTYTRVGAETAFNNAATNAYVAQLWKRDQLIPTAGVSTTFYITTTTITGGLWNTGLVMEILNPGNFAFKTASRSVQSASSGSAFSMPNTDDLFCIDFCAGGGATSTISASSGYTKAYEAATFVSSNLRHTLLISALQSQKAGRTYSYTTFGTVSSVAIWFDGPARSKPVIDLQYCGKASTSSAASSFSFPSAPIGTPAPDRMVHVLVMQVYTVALTISAISSTPTPTILPWQMWTNTNGNRAPSNLWSALVPTGTTMDFSFTSNQIGYWAVYVWASYGQQRMGVNLAASILGDVQVPRNVQVANGGSLISTGIVVPKGAILFGGGHAYTGVTAATGDWISDDNNPTSGGSGFGARIDNSAGTADMTNKTISMSMSGSNNAGQVGMSIGP